MGPKTPKPYSYKTEVASYNPEKKTDSDLIITIKLTVKTTLSRRQNNKTGTYGMIRPST